MPPEQLWDSVLRGSLWMTVPPEMRVLVLCGLHLLFSIFYCLCSRKMQILQYVGSTLPASDPQRLYVEKEEERCQKDEGPLQSLQ